MKFKKISIALLAVAAMGMASCQENEYGVVDLTPVDKEVDVDGLYTYNHPCAMYSQDDFDYVKSSLENGTAPAAVKQEFEDLKNSWLAGKGYNPSPTEEIKRGIAGDENYTNAMRDAAAAYQMAILWKLTGDNDYADTVVKILNAWVNKCVGVNGNTNKLLAAGAQGYTFANAGEIVRGYEGWNNDDFNRFKAWTIKVFAQECRAFLDGHYDTCDGHYWSNWDLVALSAYLSIGILNENNDMVNYVVNYFHRGKGNGCIKNLVQDFHADPMGSGEILGQNQESGRDQGHAQMSTAVAAHLAQMAYTLYKDNKEIADLDFFAAKDNALLSMAEYVALTNLRTGNDALNKEGLWYVAADKIPFTTYNYCIDCACNGGRPHDHGAVQETFADDGGRGNVRPGWEIYYNHYARLKGLGDGFKYSRMMADKMRPEGGVGKDGNPFGTNSGAYDQLGWNTLMLYRGE